ncbi:NERD domain-containing protein [Microbacterium esteraromaticum]|uniref:NERD domain-containing protein n=2 Tax=Microbacterium esteraromaticum TaxID=57043 RepID=A0A939DY48_9MICO|nr:NERD domain-containing protein [Microbacterium esteraromaticum]MBN8207045.1 NERD domain-containing protein [Microbacterium esteraromaticum]
MGDAAQAQEAEALDKVRQLLPDDGIARAWANVTFTDSAGRLNEVDVLMLTRAGLYVVELKGWHGTITGDQHQWMQGARRHPNPRTLANTKAKRLATVLKDVASHAKLPRNAVPFVDEAVVMHGRDSKISLDRFGAEHVWALDGFRVSGLGPDANFSTLVAQSAHHSIDLVQAKKIDALMSAAGLMPRTRQRMIGQYRLDSGEPLGEGPGWQDFLVTHPVAGTKRRIRLFAYPRGADRETRAAIDLRAQREFRLTDGIDHPGVIGPRELLSPEEGPALVFSYDEDESSLQEFLARHTDDLTFETRERLVQELSELVRFAHGQRLTHRALSPLSVRVRESADGAATLRIRDWDLARRPDSGTSTATVVSRGATDLVSMVDQAALLYLAPETLRALTTDSPQSLDVYGVGAVAFTILSGHAPALNLGALEALVASGAPGLDVRAVLPEVSDAVASAIMQATTFDEMHRLIDIADFQAAFEQARRDQRGPEAVETTADPLEATVGDIIAERFEIKSRRGSGSTGVALQVDDYATTREGDILKLAKDDAAAARLQIEASVLDRLDHPRIVKRLDGPLAVGSRQGLLMTDAGSETLADRIRLEGRATIEQLERYGADLFEMIAHLESRGVFHRDIKPSNLAVKPDPGSRKPRLTLFDFSLSEEPLNNIRSGSRPYLDPYLGSGVRKQYDSAAERFAIAATLFELASGDPVWWGDGDAPASHTDAPVVQNSMFDTGVSEGLVEFFRVALAPDASDRHPSLDSMRAAWLVALADASVDDDAAEANDARADAATLDTSLSDAGLSARALSALSRVGVTTVGELLGVPPMTINQLRGRGEQVRREIRTRIRDWRARLTTSTATAETPVGAGRRAAESYIGVISSKPGEAPEERFRRLQKSGVLKPVITDVIRWLRELEGVATVDELAAKLLREYGSTLADEQQRRAAAHAIMLASLELDARYRDPKFVFQRAADRTRIVVAYAPDDGTGFSFDEAEAHLESVLRRAAVVDALLQTDDVVAATRLREELRGEKQEVLRLSDARAAQLAIGLSSEGRMSSLGEAYRASLPPERAVEVALRSAATRELAILTIEQRVRARFPAVTSIPSRPALDAAVRTAMPYLEWRADRNKYVMREAETTSATATGSSTSWGRAAGDPAIAARLQASVRDHGALAMVVSRRRPLAIAASMLAHGYGAKVVDLADVVLTALRETAVAKNIQWQVVLGADGKDAGSQDQRNLQQLARLAVTPAWNDLLASPEPIVFINAAVLARVGLTDLIAKVMDMSTPRQAARWFLLPRPQSGSTPDLDGTPMPFGADGWLELAVDSPDAATAAATRDLNALTTRKAAVS